MHCSEDENVCSVKKENNLGYYRLHTIWRKDRFFINITSKNGAWRGEMTPNDIAKISTQLELEPEAYINQSKKALTYHGGQPGVVYMVEEGSFCWKKVEDEDSGIKIKMGSVMLEPASFVDTIQNLVTAALNCNKILEDKLKGITEEKEKLMENEAELFNKLNELIKTKEEMENDLYSRFTLLINEKKKKIQELENLLEEQYKNVENSNNPYEVETEKESEEEMTISKTSKVKRKIVKNKHKNNSLPKEAPEEKKAKSNDENDGCTKSFEGLNDLKPDSPDPSSSHFVPESKSEVSQNEEVGLPEEPTKNDLYTYFFGYL